MTAAESGDIGARHAGRWELSQIVVMSYDEPFADSCLNVSVSVPLSLARGSSNDLDAAMT
jgi:hypothetical protein